MFDVNFILDNYGLSGCFVEIVFLELVNAFLLRDAVADPCPLVSLNQKGTQIHSLTAPWTHQGLQDGILRFHFISCPVFCRVCVVPVCQVLLEPRNAPESRGNAA